LLVIYDQCVVYSWVSAGGESRFVELAGR